MTKSGFIRISGWALMVGALAFSLSIIVVLLENTSYQLFDGLSNFIKDSLVFGIFWSPVLLATGMLGLRTRYAEEIGDSGKSVLLLGALGGLLVIVGNVGQAYDPDPYWGVFITGTTLIFIGLLIFGVQALVQKPLPRMNWLPLVAGMWFPLISLPGIFGIHFPMLGQTASLIFSWFSIIGILITTIALTLLGYALQADVPEEMPAIA